MLKTSCILILITAFSAACSSLPERNPVPEEFVSEAQIPGIANARYWADDALSARKNFWGEESDPTKHQSIYGVEHNYLAISGGGPRGAFTAGFLNGWTRAGTRPEFLYVTGVSTGALIAPFAFLGPDYDHILTEVYTGISTDDIIEKRSIFKTFTLDGAFDSSPLRKLVEKYIDLEVMQAIAEKYQAGSELIVVTTDLDSARPVAWNIGAIAGSGDPKALQLIRDVLVASASVPAAFPPVMIKVEANGSLYEEMHVDGGVTSQLHLYPLQLDIVSNLAEYNIKGVPKVYVIRNGFVEAEYMVVQRKTVSIAIASMLTLMANISYGDMYRIYLETQRDGIMFNLAYVPASFDEPLKEPFDNEYMSKLYELGFELAADGYEWKSAPPDYLPD
jgi:predicted patatin/cPLA2 family phospholipase